MSTLIYIATAVVSATVVAFLLKFYIRKPKPSLYELQKELRETYGIDIIIYRSFSMAHSYHYEIVKDLDYDNSILQVCVPDRSYEEALEQAIMEGFGLIKNENFRHGKDKNLCKNS